MAYPYEQLVAWNMEKRLFPMASNPGGPLDYHRLQLERWLWDARVYMLSPIIDIGAEFSRGYLGDSYMTINTHRYETAFGEVRPQILGDLLHLPFADGSIGTLICTEVLEHIPNIFRAAGEIQRALKPGGTAFLSSPFLWPTHDTAEYGDYWRITEQGWRFMFTPFSAVKVAPMEMRQEARFLWHHLAHWEVMGNGFECRAPTGYMVEARR